ncbi:zinc alcohol dehydrogenase [Apodospora peruviana]|uniref:Zinc alcohol dehydrogenase n=1 Tax=Apodospora peruviana TaxID=516989 RepID=A0AAE0IDA9_9PEZI|nr:zinc alcohol dehydrogenase [Apodospora peruviana]
MKAWVVVRNSTSPKDALQLKTDLPVPAPVMTGNNILVKVSHAALNPADMHFMNVLPTWLPFRRTATPGLDFAGEVVATGPAAGDEFKVGAQVAAAMGTIHVTFGKGALAEYVVVPADMVSLKPEAMTLGQAVGVCGVAGQTAAIMVAAADIKPNQKVMINGASGGVGSVLLQVVKAKGAVVYAVCSASNAAMVKRLGADEAIDYNAHDPLETFVAEKFEGGQLDIIFDCAGSQPLYSNSPRYLKPQGKFISIVGGRTQGIVPYVRNKLRPVFLGGTPREFQLLGLFPAGVYARQAAKWVDEGVIKEAPIDSEFPMEEVVQAYEKLAGKHAKGKIVIKVSA